MALADHINMFFFYEESEMKGIKCFCKLQLCCPQRFQDQNLLNGVLGPWVNIVNSLF